MEQQTNSARVITIHKYEAQWNLSQTIGRYAAKLNALPDAAQVGKQKRRSAPLALLPMVF
jgi:predicted metal-dependent hydrolase